MEIFNKYPELLKPLESLYENRRNEILSHILEIDGEYKKLCSNRTDAGMALREVLTDEENQLFETYTDAAYEQEIYELDAIYRQAVTDTLFILKNSGLL